MNLRLQEVEDNIMSEESLLKVNNLKTTFYSKNKKIEAVRGVGFEVNSGDIQIGRAHV